MMSVTVVILNLGHEMNTFSGDRSRIILTLSEFFFGTLKSLAANLTCLVFDITFAERSSLIKFRMVGESLITTWGSFPGLLSQDQPTPFLRMDLAQSEKVHLFANLMRRPPTLYKSVGRLLKLLKGIRGRFTLVVSLGCGESVGGGGVLLSEGLLLWSRRLRLAGGSRVGRGTRPRRSSRRGRFSSKKPRGIVRYPVTRTLMRGYDVSK